MPPGEQDEFGILFVGCHSGNLEDVAGNVAMDFDYRLKATFDGKSFEIVLERNEFDYLRIPDGLFEMDRMKRPPYRRQDFEQGVFRFKKTIAQVIGSSDVDLNAAVAGIGPFQLSFLFMRRSTQSDKA